MFNCRKTARLAITAALLFTGVNTLAADSTRALLKHTGITTQIHHLPAMVIESSAAHARRCGSAQGNSPVIGFNPQSIIFDTVSAFNSRYSGSLAAIERWHQSSLAKKIRSAESEATDYTAFSEFKNTSTYNNPQRKNLINQIVENLQITRFVATLGTEVEYAGILHSGCINNTKNQTETRREQTLADITREDKELTALLLSGDIIAETTYMFRSLSTAELTEYASFTASASSKSIYTALIDAFHESLTLAGNRLATSQSSELLGGFDF